MHKKPLLVVPKGHLYANIMQLFESKNIAMPDEHSRQYFYPDWSDDCALFLAKPKAIPNLLYSKFAEFAFSGDDIIRNSEYSNKFFDIYNTKYNTVKICLCSRMSMAELRELKRPVIVATEFDIIASHYFTKLGIPHYILNTAGSTEGYLDINADCIIDVVDTGETLRKNNINILSVLFESSTKLYEHADLCDCMLPNNLIKILSNE